MKKRKKRKVEKKNRKVILEKKWKKGKVGTKKMKKCKKKCEKKREECIVDYYCNPQCIGCGRKVISSHPLVLCIVFKPDPV